MHDSWVMQAALVDEVLRPKHLSYPGHSVECRASQWLLPTAQSIQVLPVSSLLASPGLSTVDIVVQPVLLWVPAAAQ